MALNALYPGPFQRFEIHVKYPCPAVGGERAFLLCALADRSLLYRSAPASFLLFVFIAHSAQCSMLSVRLDSNACDARVSFLHPRVRA